MTLRSRAHHLATVVAAAVVVSLAGSGSAVAGVGTPNPASGPHPTSAATVTADFAPGTYGIFAESMTALGADLLVSTTQWNTDMSGNGTSNMGVLTRVSPSGEVSPFGEPLDLGPYGMQCGVAVSGTDAFVAYATFNSEPLPGVFRVPPAGAPPVRVMTLPDYAWPNGIAIDGDDIYVTDSGLGVVWKGATDPTAEQALALADVWYAGDELAPAPPKKRYPPIGANGIAVEPSGDVLVTNWSTGSIYRIDSAGTESTLVASDVRLLEADGITLDADGRIWVATNAGHGNLAVVDGARVSVTRTQNKWLDYPTQPVVVGSTVYLLNGSYFRNAPFVVAFTGLATG